MTKWWEKSGETSKAFNRERDTIPGGNPAFSSHSDEQLEDWREHLLGQREKPEPGQHLKIGGETERETHDRVAEENKKLLGEIEAEQMHRLMLELDHREAKERDNGQER